MSSTVERRLTELILSEMVGINEIHAKIYEEK